jgi:hypothetical protein
MIDDLGFERRGKNIESAIRRAIADVRAKEPRTP